MDNNDKVLDLGKQFWTYLIQGGPKNVYPLQSLSVPFLELELNYGT